VQGQRENLTKERRGPRRYRPSSSENLHACTELECMKDPNSGSQLLTKGGGSEKTRISVLLNPFEKLDASNLALDSAKVDAEERTAWGTVDDTAKGEKTAKKTRKLLLGFH